MEIEINGKAVNTTKLAAHASYFAVKAAVLYAFYKPAAHTFDVMSCCSTSKLGKATIKIGGKIASLAFAECCYGEVLDGIVIIVDKLHNFTEKLKKEDCINGREPDAEGVTD